MKILMPITIIMLIMGLIGAIIGMGPKEVGVQRNEMDLKNQKIDMQDQKAIFYTQEGSPYVLKVQTYSTINRAASTFPLVVQINLPENAPVSTQPSVLVFDTPNWILPLQCNFTLAQTGTSIMIANISSCYYNFTRTFNGVLLNTQNTDILSGFSKSIPHINRIFFTDNNNYAFNIRYNQIYLSQKDFIDPNEAQIRFKPNLNSSLLSTNSAFGIDNISIPPGNYDSNMTFLYFELL